ncbi:MAG TPA: recombinase family protein [bacterium]|nr:recombinase family protein [bacterium]
MRKNKKAVGYVCDIPIPGTDEVISKEDQRLRMLKFAQKEGLDLACIYEDEKFTEDFIGRPGFAKLLACKEEFDTILVERVWSLSRKKKALDPFLKELDRKGVQLMASSYLWDCLSQQLRHRYAVKLSDRCRKEARALAEARNLKVVA